MKVLLQDWDVPSEGQLVSISRDHAQLDATTLKIKKNDAESCAVYDPLEVEIPDDHEFVHMLENGSIFLHDDEMDIIIYPDQ